MALNVPLRTAQWEDYLTIAKDLQTFANCRNIYHSASDRAFGLTFAAMQIWRQLGVALRVLP